MNHCYLLFRLITENGAAAAHRIIAELLNKVNSAPWHGKPAGTCRIRDIHQISGQSLPPPGKLLSPCEFEIRVEYREPRPIPPGAASLADFNDYDFGTFVWEGPPRDPRVKRIVAL